MEKNLKQINKKENGKIGWGILLIAGLFSIYLATDGMQNKSLSINSVRGLYFLGIAGIGYGLWKYFSKKQQESNKELLILGIILIIIGVVIRWMIE